MKRINRGFGLRALIVESLGAMALLYLLFPMAASTTSPRQGSSESVSVSPVTSNAAAAALAEPQLAKRSVAKAPPRRLPTLHLPAPPASESLPSTATPNAAVTTHVGPERREFVARELDYSRRALAMMLEQHLQRLVEPFAESE